ncbi:hypothetical protein AB0D32_03355 [Micromonospora sp. NPDC048170]|uniref:hypothetical protein n=1 Tax=Micromonospora sp. NPDC048170 TaxID=3154819 RepID=UPI0033F76C24
MDRRIDLSNVDLDRVATLIAERRPTWLAQGLTVHAPTWMDNDVEWPAPLLTDRADARRPMSLGLRISREDPYAEAVFVLYAGGWADIDHVAAGSNDVASEYVEFEDAEQFGPLLDRVVAQL